MGEMMTLLKLMSRVKQAFLLVLLVVVVVTVEMGGLVTSTLVCGFERDSVTCLGSF